MPKRGHEDAEPSDPDEELTQRRERGRIAQRAFRQRQINTIRELREANQAMLDAIDAITRAAVQVGNPALMQVVQSARRAAGFDDALDGSDRGSGAAAAGRNQRAGSSSRNSMINVASSRQTSEDPDAEGEIDPSLAAAGFPLAMVTTAPPPFGYPLPVTNAPDPQLPLSIFPGIAPNAGPGGFPNSGDSQVPLRLEDVLHTPNLNAPDERRGGRMSPRLTYGLWTDPERLLNPVGPPPDLIPYLNEPSSLATVLFWFTHFNAYQSLRALVNQDGSDASNPSNAETLETARRIFGHSLTFEPGASILQRIHLRLTYRKLGYVDGDHSGNNDPDATMRLHTAVVDDLMTKGVSMGAFIQTESIEQLVRTRMGDAGYAAVVGAALAGTGQAQHVHAVRQLVIRLAQWAFCFGDGPRWRIDHVSAVLSVWMNEFGFPVQQMAQSQQGPPVSFP